MLTLDVPLVPNDEYITLLESCRENLGCVHCSLYAPAIRDARQRLESHPFPVLEQALARLAPVPAYALMNSRFHTPDTYLSTASLDAMAAILSGPVEAGYLAGVIVADLYLLQALGQAHPGLAARLEAVPSINAMLDSPDRIFATLDAIDATGFKLPSKLVLDRSLNRDLRRLESTVNAVRKALPSMKIFLMANEGCLYQCPYKPAHDAHIALVNESGCADRTFVMNRDLGCIRHMLSRPASMLASPFIRPEDLYRYEGLVHGVKLCGRNKGGAFLVRAVTAYLAGEYRGNLLDLMDAMGDLNHRVHIDNRSLGPDFFDIVTQCAKHCQACGACEELADTAISLSDPGLEPL